MAYLKTEHCAHIHSLHVQQMLNHRVSLTDVDIVKYFAQAPDLSKMLPLQKPAQYI